MQDLGIAVKATKQLNAILDAVGDLQKLEAEAGKVKTSLDEMSKDAPTKKLIADIKKMSSEGSDDLQKIKKAFQEIEEAGSLATKKQYDNFKQMIREYKALSGQRIESTQLFEVNAAKQLKKRLAVGDFSPEEAGPLSELQSQLEKGFISRTQQAQTDVMLSRADAARQFERDRTARFKSEMVPSGDEPGMPAGGAGSWGPRMSGMGKFFLGATISGVAIQAIHHWAQVDKQLVQIKQRFGDITEGVKGFGKHLGYTISESAEMSKIWGEIADTVNMGEMKQYVGFARHKGIEPAQAMELRMTGRYIAQPGGSRMLGGFERFADRMGMGQGRIGELISSYGNLAQLGARQAIGLNAGNIEGLQMFTRRLWQTVPGEEQRGMGERGAQYVERLNQSMANPQSDAVRAFLMRSYGWGKGATLSEVQERIQAGAFGKGNLQSIFSQLYGETPGTGKEERIQAMQPVFSQLGIKDIRPLMAAWEGPDREKVFAELEAGSPKSLSEDFETLGRAAISTSDKVKVFMDENRFDAVNKSIKATSELLDGEFKASLRTIINLFDGLEKSIHGLLGIKNQATLVEAMRNYNDPKFDISKLDTIPINLHLIPTKIDSSKP